MWICLTFQLRNAEASVAMVFLELWDVFALQITTEAPPTLLASGRIRSAQREFLHTKTSRLIYTASVTQQCVATRFSPHRESVSRNVAIS